MGVDRHPEEQERPAPSEEHGDAADDEGADRLHDPPDHRGGGGDASAQRDGVGVGQQRTVHRQRVRLGDAGPEARPEQHERADGQAGQEHHGAEHEAGDAHDGPPLVTVGEVPHRHGAEHEERRRSRRDEHDHPVAHPEGVADVRGEHGHRRRLELVEAVEDQQDDERERSGGGEPGARGWVGRRRRRRRQ